MMPSKPTKRSVGRPLGRDYTDQIRVPLRPEDRLQIDQLAEWLGLSRAEIVRDAVERRHRAVSKSRLPNSL